MSSSPVALITAGSAGLGAAAARLFAQHGYRVVINYNSNAQRAEALCAEINTAAAAAKNSNQHQQQQQQEEVATTTAIQADLGSHSDVERLVAETAKWSGDGRLDVVFSNGGWTRFTTPGSLEDNAVEADWDRAFAVNVKSHLWLLRAARPYLDAAEGVFIATSSIAGFSGMGSSLAYSATKAAQLHMIRGLATLVAPKIRVNSVSPGLLLTEWAERFTDEQKEAHRQKTKLQRFVTVEDVAAQVLGLATSKSMTGVNIVVDAGATV